MGFLGAWDGSTTGLLNDSRHTFTHVLDSFWAKASIIIAVCLLVLFWLDTTDIPHIRGIPAVPGLPIFGNLLQLGQEHPRRYKALSTKYGPVFQVRLGNKVRLPHGAMTCLCLPAK